VPVAGVPPDESAQVRQLLRGGLSRRYRFGEALDLRGQVLLRDLASGAKAGDALACAGGETHGRQRVLIEEEELLLDPEAGHPRPQ